jgi:hypothetical protein
MRGNGADRNKISTGTCQAFDMLREILGQFIECTGAHTLKNKLNIGVRNEKSWRYAPRHELPRQALIIVDGRAGPQATDQTDSLAWFFCQQSSAHNPARSFIRKKRSLGVDPKRR